MNETRDELRTIREDRSKAVDNMKEEYEGLVAQLKTRLETKETNERILTKELEATKQALTLREKDAATLKAHVKRSEEEISKLEKSTD